MVGRVALDDVLRLIFRSMPLVALEGDLRGHFLLDRSSDQPRFRIPLNVIATLEVSCHWLYLLKRPLEAIDRLRLPKLRLFDQGKENNFFASNSADVVVHTRHFDTSDFMDQ